MASWKGKTRGGLFGYRFFVFILKTFGLSFSYFILYFVAAYFIPFAPSSTRFSYLYFRRVLGYRPFRAARSVYGSYFIFGQTLLDKIAIRSGMKSKFTYTFKGRENLEALAETGGVVLSAHLGNWEIAGYLLNESKIKTNILMYEAEHERIKGFLDKVMTETKVNIIPIRPDFSHIFKLNAALKNKELVCMHGDRFMEGSKIQNQKFLNMDAAFPMGTFLMVQKLGVPFAIAYAIRGKRRTYHLSSTPMQVPGSKIEETIDFYINNLERKLEENPLQWFNYYDFWGMRQKENS